MESQIGSLGDVHASSRRRSRASDQAVRVVVTRRTPAGGTVLRRVYAQCPDLVPEPLDADLNAHPPFVAMSVLPGSPLTGIVDIQQQTALADALRRLWSVPAVNLPVRRDHPAEIHALMIRRMTGLDLPGLAGEAARAARSFLAQLRLCPGGCTVLGHIDPNLANYLWDGHRVRIVDFEDAGRSDPEFELADLVEHIAARNTDWTPFLATSTSTVTGSSTPAAVRRLLAPYASPWRPRRTPQPVGNPPTAGRTAPSPAHLIITLDTRSRSLSWPQSARRNATNTNCSVAGDGHSVLGQSRGAPDREWHRHQPAPASEANVQLRGAIAAAQPG